MISHGQSACGIADCFNQYFNSVAIDLGNRLHSRYGSLPKYEYAYPISDVFVWFLMMNGSQLEMIGKKSYMIIFSRVVYCYTGNYTLF